MNYLLGISRWGLFLLLIGIPLAGFPFTIFGMVLGSKILVSLVYILILFIPSLLFLLWLFSGGRMLYGMLDPAEREKLNYKLFRFNLFFALAYLVLAFILMFVVFDSAVLYHFLFYPVHLYAVFCLLFGIYFLARSLAMVEGEGDDFVGNIFLLWFFPIGLWIIQPKINSLYHDKS